MYQLLATLSTPLIPPLAQPTAGTLAETGMSTLLAGLTHQQQLMAQYISAMAVRLIAQMEQSFRHKAFKEVEELEVI